MKYLKVFTDFKDFMEPLTDEEKGRLFSAMLTYAEDGRQEDLSGNERFVWAMARRIIDREAEVYESKVEAAREAGRKSVEARRTRMQALTPATGGNEAQPKGTGADETEPKGTGADETNKEKEYEKEQEKEYEQENDQEKEEENSKEYSQEYVYVSRENEPMTGTHTPEREDIAQYCAERKNGIDPDYFYDFYAAKGWRVGQDPILDWRAMIRTWERRNAQGDLGSTGIKDAVEGVLAMARQKRAARQRNTLLNYREEPSGSTPAIIDLDPDEL